MRQGAREDVDAEANPDEVEIFQVSAEEVRKQRLDAFLSEKYSQSRSYFEALIDRGAVLVNGQVKKKAFRELRAGDEVVVRFLLDERTMPLKPEAIPLDILYEDADIIVVNKPAGLVVHPAPGNWSGTLVNAVLGHLATAGAAAGTPTLPAAPPGPEAQHRPGVVHRLDVGTSGIVTVSKTAAAFATLSQAFARREVSKTYLAVSSGSRRAYRGHGPGGGHLIDLPIGRCPEDRLRMAVVPEKAGGRPSLSRVRALAEDERNETALLEVSPTTGRTHQIRVHLAAMHTPVLGDATYGGPNANRHFASLARRPVLHARRLAFAHPRTGQRVEFVAPLPSDMCALLRRMAPVPGEAETYKHLLETSSHAVLVE